MRLDQQLVRILEATVDTEERSHLRAADAQQRRPVGPARDRLSDIEARRGLVMFAQPGQDRPGIERSDNGFAHQAHALGLCTGVQQPLDGTCRLAPHQAHAVCGAEQGIHSGVVGRRSRVMRFVRRPEAVRVGEPGAGRGMAHGVDALRTRGNGLPVGFEQAFALRMLLGHDRLGQPSIGCARWVGSSSVGVRQREPMLGLVDTREQRGDLTACHGQSPPQRQRALRRRTMFQMARRRIGQLEGTPAVALTQVPGQLDQELSPCCAGRAGQRGLDGGDPRGRRIQIHR